MPIPAILGMAALTAGSQIYASQQQKQANKRSLQMQGTLNAQQLQNQKELNKYNQQLAMQTWEDTNYSAQVREMEKAGLNVGMMYGQGGAGGGTLGQQGGSAQGGQAPDQTAMARSAMQSGLQNNMMTQAQIDLMKAQTEKTKVETAKTAGVDTEGAQLQNTGTAIDNRIKEVKAQVQEATTEQQKEVLWSEAQKAYGQARSADAQGQVDMSVANERIEQARLQTVIMGVEIKAKEAGIELTEEQTKETSEKINKIVAEVERMKDMTAIQKEQLLQQRMQVEFNTSTPAQIKQWTSIGTEILNATKGGGSKTTTINQDNRRSYDNSNTNFNE